MTQTQTAGLTPGGGWTQTRAAATSYRYDTTQTADRQTSWQQSKAAADRTWPATRALLQGLGFTDAQPTARADDWRGVDVTAFRGGRPVRLAWRCRDRRFIGYRDVTIRKARPNGASTEVHKLAAGGADLCLWTWVRGGAVCDWLLVSVPALRPLLAQPWPTLTMCDAEAACIPWRSLAEAGCIVTASRGVKAALHG